jgi:hypothetical protein
MNRPVTPRQVIRTVLPPLLLAALVTAISYAATGPTTGLFFAGVVFATLIAPPLLAAEESLLAQLLCAAAIVDGIGVVWLVAVADPSISFWDWFRSYVVLASYICALWGLTTLLRRLRLRGLAASALVIVLSLSWLSWPIWMSPWIAGREALVGWLTPAHPLLALDTVLRALGPPWSERFYMYNHLSVLNQDVVYDLPRGILPAVLLHSGIGAIGVLLGRRRRHRAMGLEVDVPDGSGSSSDKEGVSEELLP